MGIITISYEDNKCFYHVMGDVKRYFDINSIIREHQEYAEYIEGHRLELEFELSRQKELVGDNEKY
jgi:hypothetical protein